MRVTDVAGRYGGEEILVILYAERLRGWLRRCWRSDGAMQVEDAKFAGAGWSTGPASRSAWVCAAY